MSSSIVVSPMRQFSNNTFQTMQPNEILALLCNGGKGFSKKRAAKMLLSPVW